MFLNRFLVNTVIRQGEKINELDIECTKKNHVIENIKRHIKNADEKQENYFITFKKIEKELDQV